MSLRGFGIIVHPMKRLGYMAARITPEGRDEMPDASPRRSGRHYPRTPPRREVMKVRDEARRHAMRVRHISHGHWRAVAAAALAGLGLAGSVLVAPTRSASFESQRTDAVAGGSRSAPHASGTAGDRGRPSDSKSGGVAGASNVSP